jgi:hypothetical protein
MVVARYHKEAYSGNSSPTHQRMNGKWRDVPITPAEYGEVQTIQYAGHSGNLKARLREVGQRYNDDRNMADSELLNQLVIEATEKGWSPSEIGRASLLGGAIVRSRKGNLKAEGRLP